MSDEQAELRASQTYYRRFYERGELGRVWAAEHTGLLEREDREELESDFKEGHRPDAPNLLSCTPTLEMGIDIGDLSATMLMSVPPSTSSYLQRIGRAGRKTGNALVLTFTQATPHDLHFFDDPEAAMAGTVDPPGCYLDAPAILKRQALAWCLDAWARDATDGEGLPPQVRDALRGDETRRFPAPLFRFIEKRRRDLRESFLRVFGTSDATRAQLERHLGGTGYAASPMEQELAAVFERLVAERDDLRRLHRRVKDKLKQLDEAGMKVENADEEREELERERQFLERELSDLQKKSLIAMLTERSVLPNYAFPEAGVQLKAYVSRESGPKGRPQPERYDWTRAASTAIRELAPFNTFYGMARRVRVDSIKVGSGKVGRSGELIESWQLCSDCGHMERASTLTSQEDCPRCGAPGWREQGRRRELVRMRDVAAFARQRDAAFSDESESRDQQFYITEHFFDPDPNTARHAWLDRQTPFGFELLPDLTIREINFGRTYVVPKSQKLGGHEIPEVEFQVCEECGQVHDPNSKVPAGGFTHRRWCSARDKAADKQPYRSIHLYREVTTEALRLFVPVAMLDPNVRLPNVRAGIELGLKLFFGGDPDHLRVQLYSEPSSEDRRSRRRFVVIHDTVPGGTGVLAELAADGGAKLRRVLELAREALASCSCAESEAAACYRCLYAHRHQRDLPVLDRSLALTLMDQLLSSFDRLEQVKTIGELDTATVTESELEDRFVQSLQRWAQATEGASFAQTAHDTWSMEVDGRSWTLQGQVTLDAGHDVAIPTRPDFVFWPSDDEARSVAVYCDGFAYHVQPHETRARIADDFHKREAVCRSGRFAVCSLTWDDLDEHDYGKPGLAPWLENEGWRSTAAQLAGKLGSKAETAIALERGPMDWLLAYLANPEEERWRSASTLCLFGALASQQRGRRETLADLTTKLRTSELAPSLLVEADAGSDEVYATARLGGHPAAKLLWHVGVESLGTLHDKPDSLTLTLRLDDSHTRRGEAAFTGAWRSFLRAHMALQWLPGLRVVTTEQLQSPPEVEYTEAPLDSRAVSQAAEMAEGLLSAAALDALRDADDAVRALVEAAMRAGAPVPDIPFEHGTGSSGVDSVVEVGWPTLKLALFLPGEEEDAEALAEEGWRCFGADDLSEQVLLDVLRELQEKP